RLWTENAASELVRRVVRDAQRIVKFRRLHHGEHGPENLVTRDGVLGTDAGKNMRADEISAGLLRELRGHFAGELEFAFALPDLDVSPNFRGSFGINDRANICAGKHGIAD